MIVVTGGAGYVGSALIQRLKDPVVIDIGWYGYKPDCTYIQADIRDISVECDTLYHLASVSNDPTFDLDPALGASINFTALHNLHARKSVFASSSSVYGIHPMPDESSVPNPITDYAALKLAGERFFNVSLRCATVCGVAPRMRFDTVVNMFCKQAYFDHEITVHGGDQVRPLIHIDDAVDAYLAAKDWPDGVYNVGAENWKLLDLAYAVQTVIDCEVVLDVTKVDHRSYNLDCSKFQSMHGSKKTVVDAICDLKDLFDSGFQPRYEHVNIQVMRDLQ